MELLLVTGRFPERSETFIYRKAVGLTDRGYQVTVLAREIGDWSLYDPPPGALRVVAVPPDLVRRDPRKSLRAITGGLAEAVRRPKRTLQLVREIAAERGDVIRQTLRHLPLLERRADIVHFEFLGAALMYPRARALLDAKIVVSCRGQDIHRLPLFTSEQRAPYLAVLDEADAVHCVSEELATSVRRWTGRRHQIWVNRPAVAIPAERVAPTRSRPRIVASGRLSWIKGFDYLLAALARLAARGVDFEAEIIGAGELEKPLRFSIADLGLTERVRLVGGVSSREALARIADADLFVLPSHNEGISNAVLEAMAAGVPIVTTDAGGMAEAVTDGTEGFVIPTRDIAALADRIGRLCAVPQLRHRFGVAARARARAEFALERQLDVFDAMYRQLGARR